MTHQTNCCFGMFPTLWTISTSAFDSIHRTGNWQLAIGNRQFSLLLDEHSG
jgi:hypothetical protein